MLKCSNTNQSPNQSIVSLHIKPPSRHCLGPLSNKTCLSVEVVLATVAFVSGILRLVLNWNPSTLDPRFAQFNGPRMVLASSSLPTDLPETNSLYGTTHPSSKWQITSLLTPKESSTWQSALMEPPLQLLPVMSAFVSGRSLMLLLPLPKRKLLNHQELVHPAPEFPI